MVDLDLDDVKLDIHPGLGPAEVEHVFEPFARGAAAKGDGAGLGLAIALAIAEEHGGRLDVQSELGAGATFRFALPVYSSSMRSSSTPSTSSR